MLARRQDPPVRPVTLTVLVSSEAPLGPDPFALGDRLVLVPPCSRISFRRIVDANGGMLASNVAFVDSLRVGLTFRIDT